MILKISFLTGTFSANIAPGPLVEAPTNDEPSTNMDSAYIAHRPLVEASTNDEPSTNMDSTIIDPRPLAEASTSYEPSTNMDSANIAPRLLVEAFTNAEPSTHMDSANIAQRPLVEPSTNYVHTGNAATSAQRRNSSKRRRLEEISMPPPLAAVPLRAFGLAGPATVLASTIQLEKWDPTPSIVLTGAAKAGRAGPPVGLVDIGISKYAYLFRVALPGVTKDNCQFSCEVQSDGRVELRGRTITGERVIRRDVFEGTHVFEMKTQHLCESGPFTVSFSLPGPVDPRLFKADFYPDGILQAMVMKKYQQTNFLS
ncbi:uncharacterized protein LOC143845953 isoform X2 [Tasmannia lanceolata]|uniref:uncharacterized protein LOC143845953 isoform X2 n=1 Tax=Tasmannia lanceolata TaxID=3420 RepID=UPI0040632FAF